MLTILSLLLGQLFYNNDIIALGDSDFQTRKLAHSRLIKAGWWAYPCLRDGLHSSCPERADRCERLISKLYNPDQYIMLLTERAAIEIVNSEQSAPELTPETWLLLEWAICRSAETSAPVDIRSTDGSKSTNLSCGFKEWVKQPAFYDGSHPAEVRLLAESVRKKKTTAKK